ncbi:MAG: hypothetical protein KGJ62_12215 [Armatimonadetes bacterium]|nr:hypothetical protein [Armatimonadota bacterium]MDE2206310.1 hypothetical protein [Armatimonadota bacterium]
MGWTRKPLPRLLPNGLPSSTLWFIAVYAGLSSAIVLKFGVAAASALFFSTAHLGSPLLVLSRAPSVAGWEVSALVYGSLSGAAIASAGAVWWVGFLLRRVAPISAGLAWVCGATAAATWGAIVFAAARTVWNVAWWGTALVLLTAAAVGLRATGPMVEILQSRTWARRALAAGAAILFAALAIAGQRYRGYGDALQVSHRVDLSMAHLRSRGPEAWRRVMLDDYYADDMGAMATDAAAEYEMWPDASRRLGLGEALALAGRQHDAAADFRAVISATRDAPVGSADQVLHGMAEQDLQEVQR